METLPPAAEPSPPLRLSTRLAPLLTPALTLILTILFTILSYRAAGPTLGYFLGGLLAVTLIPPAMTLAMPAGLRQLLPWAMTILGLGSAWLWTLPSTGLTGWEWASALLIVAAYSAALCALTALLHHLRLPASLASAASTVIGLAWLTWPIWMAPHLAGAESERTVAKLVAPHPALTMNGVLRRPFPTPWAQLRIAYRLTNIGDDIPYTLPTNPAGCAGLHGAMALGLAGGAWLLERQRARPRPLPPAASP